MKTLDDARQQAAKNLGYDLQGGKGGNLNQTQFFQLEAEMARVIVSDPSSYSASVLDWAKTRTTAYIPQTLGFVEGVKIFGEEFGNQAVKINEAVNPFSESNREGIGGTVKTLLVVGIIAAAAFYFAPQITKAVKDATAK